MNAGHLAIAAGLFAIAAALAAPLVIDDSEKLTPRQRECMDATERTLGQYPGFKWDSIYVKCLMGQ